MGRCPLAIPLAILVLIIIISDYSGIGHDIEPPIDKYAIYSCDIIDIHEAETSGRLATARIDSINGNKIEPFKARLHLLDETPIITAGQTIRFGGAIKTIKPKIDIPDAIDLNRDLRIRGITFRAVVPDDSIHYVDDTAGLTATLQRANAAVISHLHSLPLSDLSIEMLSAMLLGKGEYLTNDSRELFSASGLSHILALSGLHVGVIAMIISFLLWPLYFSRHVKTRLIISILTLWLYASFTGFIPSVTRAVIMTTIYLGGRILQRNTVSLNSLCLAAIVILVIQPSDLYSLGFQLSFAAVLGIILWFPLINQVNRRKHPLVYWLVSFPTLSISAMIFAGVISTFYFHQFPLMFIVANVFVAPLVPLFIISGIISLAFSISEPTNFFASCIEFIAKFVNSSPIANLTELYPPLWYVIFICILLIILALSLHYKNRFFIYESSLLIVGLNLFLIFTPPIEYPRHEAYLISEPSSSIIIERIDNECKLYSPLKALSERVAQKELYELILQDFLTLRNVDSIQVMPIDAIPICLNEEKSVTLHK